MQWWKVGTRGVVTYGVSGSSSQRQGITSGGWVSCMLLKADRHPCSSSPSLTECDRLIWWITVGTVGRGWPLWHPPTWWCGPPSVHALITAFLTPVHTWMSELCSRLGRSSCFLQCICSRCIVCARFFTIFIYQAPLCAFKLHLRYQYIFSAYLVSSALCLSSFTKLWG